MLDLENGLSSEPAKQNSLNRMLVNLEDEGEFEYERACFVLFEADAASESVEARDWKGLVELREYKVLKFENLARFLLNFHVIVVAMISKSLLFLGDCGRLRHFSRGIEIEVEQVRNQWKTLMNSRLVIDDIGAVTKEDSHFGLFYVLSVEVFRV